MNNEEIFVEKTQGTFIKVNNEKDLEDALLFLFSNDYDKKNIELESEGLYPKYIFIWNPSYELEKSITIHTADTYKKYYIHDSRFFTIKWSDDLFKELNRKPIEEIEINLKKLEDKFK